MNFDCGSVDDCDDSVVDNNDDEENDDVDFDLGSAELEPDVATSIKFDFVSVDSFVGLNPPSNALELFYLVKITNENVSTDNLLDKHGHSIARGQQYFTGTYYEKIKETSTYVQLKKQ